MKGYWHLFIGTVTVALSYLLVLANLGLAITMMACAMIPDFDILVYSSYSRDEDGWKIKRGIGGHRDGLFHSAIPGIALFVGYVFSNASRAEWNHCLFFCVAYLSHLVADFKNCKGTIRFFKGKLVLRGHKSTYWLLCNALALTSIVAVII